MNCDAFWTEYARPVLKWAWNAGIATFLGKKILWVKRRLVGPDVILNVTLPNQYNVTSLTDLRFSFTDIKFAVHPFIIESLTTQLCDSKPVHLSVLLEGARKANAFYDDEVKKCGDFICSERDGCLFGYKFIGCVENTVLVLQTVLNGGGSGSFYRLLFCSIIQRDVILDIYLGEMDKLMTLNLIGEMGLGDRFEGSVVLEGNIVTVDGRDNYEEDLFNDYKIDIQINNNIKIVHLESEKEGLVREGAKR